MTPFELVFLICVATGPGDVGCRNFPYPEPLTEEQCHRAGQYMVPVIGRSLLVRGVFPTVRYGCRPWGLDAQK